MTKDEALDLALEALEWQQHMLITAMQYSAAKGMTFLGHPPNPNEAITAIKQALAAPVQEPVAYLCENAVGHKYFRWKKPSSEFKPTALYTTPPAAAVLEGRDWSLLEATQESLREHMAEIKRLKAAQPSVPDAIHHTDLNESLEYIQGWNDCRQAMLEMMK